MGKKTKKLSEVIGDYSMAGSRKNDAPGNIRAGQFVKSQRTNVLADEESMYAKLRRTSRLIVVRKDGKILAIESPKSSFYLTLPGGRVESGESDEDAAVRELYEETGLLADKIVKIRSDVVSEKIVTLFRVISASGKLTPSKEGIPRWVNPSELKDTKYGDYHVSVLSDLGIL